MPRTVEDFVKDMLKRGKTCEQVRCVALASRWEPQTDVAMETCKKLSKGKKK